MHLNKRNNMYLAGGVIIFVAFVCVFSVGFARESQDEKAGENSKCYVCHETMKTEELTVNHLTLDVTCDECHGLSTEHMHDEMLMTKPDLLFGRSEVRAMCSNPSCHKPGGERSVYGLADHDSKAVEEFIKTWRGRIRPNGRAVTHDSICTDCHGTHNITQAAEQQAGNEQPVEWAAVFNGSDLTGWQTSGDISWTVKRSRIVAAPGANGKSGVLWTKDEYEDYLLAITFQASWPIHAGIWLRGTGAEQVAEKGVRIEIFDSAKSMAFTGSVIVQGKGLALANLRDDLLDKEGWNTLSAKVQGDKIQVWLNGEEIGVVRAAGPAKGKIGIYIEGKTASRSTELQVREVQIQKLKKEE
ncbi:MAG: family 16 glycoside hydrolase [Planctomycetota bacterium]